MKCLKGFGEGSIITDIYLKEAGQIKRIAMIKRPISEQSKLWMHTGAFEPYLDTFLVIDPADHPHTHLSDLTEGWLLQTDVSEDLDHPFSYTDTGVLCTKKEKRNIKGFVPQALAGPLFS